MRYLFSFLLSMAAVWPAFAGVAIVNGLSHIHQTFAGAIVEGRIDIQNTGENLQNIRMYLRDYHFEASGESFYENPGTLNRSNAQWIHLGQAYFPLPAGQSLSIPYRVMIPQSAVLSGSYWSVIMVEGVPSLDDKGVKGSVQIQTLLRYAIQIVTNIGQNGKKNLLFDRAQLLKESGKSYLEVDISNNGDMLLRPELILQLYDMDGMLLRTLHSDPKKCYPGTSLRFQLPLDGLPNGLFKAVLLAECSEEDVFGVNLSLELTEDD